MHCDPELATKFLNLCDEDPAKALDVLQGLSDLVEKDDTTKKEREKGAETSHEDKVIFYNNDDETFGYNFSDKRDLNNKEEIIGINTKNVNLNNFGELLGVLLHEKQNTREHKDTKYDDSLINHLIKYNNILDRNYDYNDLKSKDKDASKTWNEKYKNDEVLTNGNETRARNYETDKAFEKDLRVNLEEAKIGKRKLDKPILGTILYMFQSEKRDQKNQEGIHEHIFFEDEKGGNIGFMGKKEGLAPDENKNLPKYKITEIGYDDKIVREAINNIKDRYSAESYSLLNHNCQHFVEDVRQEYKRIMEKK